MNWGCNLQFDNLQFTIYWAIGVFYNLYSHGCEFGGTLFHEPLGRGGCSADANRLHTLQPLGIDFFGTLDEVAVGVDAPALVEEHLAIAALVTADEEDEVVAGSKLRDVRHAVGNASTDGIE